MRWQLIIEEFGPNIQDLFGVDIIVSYTLGIFPSTSVKKYEPITSKSQCCANELFEIVREENKEDFVPLNILNMKI